MFYTNLKLIVGEVARETDASRSGLPDLRDIWSPDPRRSRSSLPYAAFVIRSEGVGKLRQARRAIPIARVCLPLTSVEHAPLRKLRSIQLPCELVLCGI